MDPIASWALNLFEELEGRPLTARDMHLVAEFEQVLLNRASEFGDLRNGGVLRGQILTGQGRKELVAQELGERLELIVTRLRDVLGQLDNVPRGDLQPISYEETARRALGEGIYLKLTDRVDSWARRIVERTLAQSSSHGFEPESVNDAMQEDFPDLFAYCKANFYSGYPDYTRRSIEAAIRQRALGHLDNVAEVEASGWFDGFELVDSVPESELRFDGPDFALLADGPGLLDCAIEVGRVGVDLTFDGYAGWRPHSEETVSRTEDFVEWVVANAPWNAEALETAKSVPNNIGWIVLDSVAVLAFPIEEIPAAVRAYTAFLKTVEFERC